MRNLWVLLLLASPSAAFAESSVALEREQCVWRAGDNSAWAAPTLDESGWQPLREFKGTTARVWVRCHADIRSLQNATKPALQVWLEAAYQVFLNGRFTGSSGNLNTAFRSVDTVRAYPLREGLIKDGVLTIALRIAARPDNGAPINPPDFRVGDDLGLRSIRALYVVQRSSNVLVFVAPFFIVGIIGLLQVGLFYFDRARHDILWLSIACVLQAVGKVAILLKCLLIDYSAEGETFLICISGFDILFEFLFFFTVAGRRIPRIFWLLVLIAELPYALMIVQCFTSPESAWRAVGISDRLELNEMAYLCRIALGLVPLLVWWPWTRHASRLRPLIISCCLWGAAEAVFSANRMINIPLLEQHFPQFFASVAVCSCIPVLALLWLLFRDQHQITQEHATLAGELNAAREIQFLLSPDKVISIPGVAIEVAFRPMRDVGGDFYLCRILVSGTQRLLIGDVSGKGAAAAMTAALLIGGAQDHDDCGPGELLGHLNRVLRESHVGGFATCLCADFAPYGSVTIANAGHLPPYRHGREVSVDGSLPLGLAPSDSYGELGIPLEPGDTITFLSDGVVEARNSTGELLGFERAAALSIQSAEEIARVAQSFGQEDDITVLAVTFTGTQDPQRGSQTATIRDGFIPGVSDSPLYEL